MVPLFVTWAEGLSTETVGEDLFLAKIRTKFEWRLFFFGLHLILGQKPDWIWVKAFFFFGLHLILGQKPLKFGQENELGFGLEILHSGLH